MEITRSILDQTLVILGTNKEGIVEILDECFGAFCTRVIIVVEACALSFCEFRA